MADVSQKWLEGLVFLVPFTRHYSEKLHASKIAQLLQLPQKTVARKLKYLEEVKFLQYSREGKNKYYFLDIQESFTFSLLEMVENYKELQFYSGYPAHSLFFRELSLVSSAILFGSYAKGLAKPHSDLDVVIFSSRNKKILSLIEKYPFQVNAHFVSLALFERRLKERQSLAKEIAQDHILFGKKERIIKIFVDHSKR